MGSNVTKKLATSPLCNGGFGADDIVEEVAIVRKHGVTKVIDGPTYRYGLEQKQINTQRMVVAVNEVKKLEVELDRAGQNLSQIQQRYSECEASVMELRVRLKKVREQLLIVREAERRRSP
ncbi:unnamed protein product [Angiostrongylus costaricensis]|uniref:Kinesin motor domain-containing protein n=1 Tax=Angiostrongylus costaricensis TaxID=334426 RepID=A0A0R3PMQ8_ANGCS|nr:unnamed protein product [Angiostrongylus costaricensis]